MANGFVFIFNFIVNCCVAQRWEKTKTGWEESKRSSKEMGKKENRRRKCKNGRKINLKVLNHPI
jgi:hypothetical protein